MGIAARSNAVARSTASHIKLSFTEGGFSSMKAEMEKMLESRMWKKLEVNRVIIRYFNYFQLITIIICLIWQNR